MRSFLHTHACLYLFQSWLMFHFKWFFSSAFSAAFSLKGNVWLVKYHNSTKKEVRRVFIPKEIQDQPSKFEVFMDRQTGEDANFRIRSRNTWLDFIHFQEDRLHDSNNLIKKFTIAEATGTYNKGNKHILKISIGLQHKEVDFKSEVDRTQERYIFDEHSILIIKESLWQR